jgi:hypothetical protein
VRDHLKVWSEKQSPRSMHNAIEEGMQRAWIDNVIQPLERALGTALPKNDLFNEIKEFVWTDQWRRMRAGNDNLDKLLRCNQPTYRQSVRLAAWGHRIAAARSAEEVSSVQVVLDLAWAFLTALPSTACFDADAT